MQITETRCDRCEKVLDRVAITITVNYHHPAKLELCDRCENHFTMWLGKHPLWETPMSKIRNGGCVGGGYPTEGELGHASKYDLLRA